jgi:hypothetical protein
MWMPLLEGEHVSTDVAVVDAEPRWWRHMVGKTLSSAEAQVGLEDAAADGLEVPTSTGRAGSRRSSSSTGTGAGRTPTRIDATATASSSSALTGAIAPCSADQFNSERDLPGGGAAAVNRCPGPDREIEQT